MGIAVPRLSDGFRRPAHVRFQDIWASRRLHAIVHCAAEGDVVAITCTRSDESRHQHWRAQRCVGLPCVQVAQQGFMRGPPKHSPSMISR
jgi:hypothetical protein